jgi:hypothetical protein
LFRRDLTRLLQELHAFPDDLCLWRTLPGIGNSAGNLALHLEGNLREYIGRQIGNVSYQRDRNAEFATPQLPKSELIQRLDGVHQLIPPIVAALPADTLAATYPEQVFGAPISTGQFLLSLYGHLNYHLGQIDYLRRILTNGKAIDFARL